MLFPKLNSLAKKRLCLVARQILSPKKKVADWQMVDRLLMTIIRLISKERAICELITMFTTNNN